MEKQAEFTLDGFYEKGISFKGTHNSNITWNGWNCPTFTVKVAKEILSSLFKEYGSEFKYRIESNKILTYSSNYDKWEEWDIKNNKVALFSFAWCWYIFE